MPTTAKIITDATGKQWRESEAHERPEAMGIIRNGSLIICRAGESLPEPLLTDHLSFDDYMTAKALQGMANDLLSSRPQ